LVKTNGAVIAIVCKWFKLEKKWILKNI
jgi:hypothetical protein